MAQANEEGDEMPNIKHTQPFNKDIIYVKAGNNRPVNLKTDHCNRIAIGLQ